MNIRLEHWFSRDTFRALRLRMREERLGLSAGSLTFTTVIALVPMLTVALALLTAFPVFNQFQGAIEKFLIESLIPPNISKQVLGYLGQFAAKASRLTSFGLAALFLSAFALIFTIDRTFNGIWRVRATRKFSEKILLYWAAMTLGPLLLGASLSLSSYLIATSSDWVGTSQKSLRWILEIVEYLLFAASLSATYRFVPNTRVAWRDALTGGLLASLGFELAKMALAYYVRSVPTFSAVYGAFATVPIFLVWVYASWIIVLLGAVVAAYAPHWRFRIKPISHLPGGRLAESLQLIKLLRDHKDSQPRGRTQWDLIEDTRIDPLRLEVLLEVLVKLDWVARIIEPQATRYVLICDPRVTPALPLISELMLDPQLQVGRLALHARFESLSLFDLLVESPKHSVVQ